MITTGAVLLAVAAFAWMKRDEVAGFLHSQFARDEVTIEAAAITQTSSAEAAKRAERKIIALGRGDTREVQLTPEEIDAWVSQSLKGFFPNYVDGVHASIDDDERLVLTGMVSIRDVPGMDRFGPLIRLVGDTAPVLISGRLDGLAPGRGVYYVEHARVGPLPLPESVREQLLSQLGQETDEWLPAGAVAFELPRFVTDIAVRNGQIYLRGCGRREC